MKSPNIDIKDIKNILAKLSVLKNNLGLLVPIVIAVVGLLLVIPTGILSARLCSTAQKNSVEVGNQIKQITARLQEDKPVPQKLLDAMVQDANQIERLMEQANKRELLNYAVFLDPNDLSRERFTQFGQRYREGVAALIGGLNPGDAPVLEDILAALTSALRPTDAAGGAYGPGRAAELSPQSNLSFESLTDAQRKIIEQLCLGKALGARIYASPSDVAGYTTWAGWTFQGYDEAYRDCWYWQLGYWIVEDVVATIQQMNGAAENITTAPVKRLMGVSFAFRQPGYGARTGGGNVVAAVGSSESERPVYVTGPTKGLTGTPCTARICNATADVLHFEVQVVVDATQVMPFMQALCSAKPHRYRGVDGTEPEQKFEHNQITILEFTEDPVEPTDLPHRFYRYGDRRAAKLDLICEYLLTRTPAYERIKPVQAKKDLGEGADAAN